MRSYTGPSVYNIYYTIAVRLNVAFALDRIYLTCTLQQHTRMPPRGDKNYNAAGRERCARRGENCQIFDVWLKKNEQKSFRNNYGSVYTDV